MLASLAGGFHRSQRSIAADVGVEGPNLTHHVDRMGTAGLSAADTPVLADTRVSFTMVPDDGDLRITGMQSDGRGARLVRS